MPLIDIVEQSLLNHLLTDPAYTPPDPLYLALSSTTPTRTGTNFTEQTIGVNGYARVSTAAADWSAASGSIPAVKTNTAVKTFPTASGDWLAGVNMTYFGLYSLATGGTLLGYGLLAVAKPVLSGDTASFAASSLVLELGAPGDVF